MQQGPDPQFREPGAEIVDAEFSLSIEAGPFLFDRPDDYARAKSDDFPDEGGPVILAVDVPDIVVEKAVSDWFPLSQGLVQFDHGNGMEELLDVWTELWKEIRSV